MPPPSAATPDEAGPRAGSGPIYWEKFASTPPPEGNVEKGPPAPAADAHFPLLLLVEDDDHDAFFFQNALHAAGVSIRMLRLRDGQRAIDYFQGRHGFADRAHFPLPQILLLDLKMPRRNGLDVLRFLRSSPEFDKVLAVILTSSSEEKEIQEAHRLHAATYLIKPCKVAALVDIARHLEELWLKTAAGS